jgi:peptidoglycan/xylan/chitin deacetylase (PgdA/CDA1 family)
VTVNFTLRKRLMSAAFSVVTIAVAGAAGAIAYTVANVNSQAASILSPLPSSSLAGVARVADELVPLSIASEVPVLVYHEMDNGCPSSGATCPSHDYETVSTAQFTAEMAWMHSQGYHTVSLRQYLAWLADKETRLPSKPFLITVDNGITDFLAGAQPILYHYRYTATSFVVTGFADAAAGKCGPRIDGVDVQPGCPGSSEGGDWDMTWAQLRALSPAVYSFGIEAGADGHYQQDYDTACYAFNACKLPSESDEAYTERVRVEYARGIAEAKSELGSRFDGDAWVVPYSDLGYTCSGGCSSFEGYDGPPGWLVSYAATTYHAAFVQDPPRNGIRNERFRYEVHNTTTLPQFEEAVRHYLALGSWDRR